MMRIGIGKCPTCGEPAMSIVERILQRYGLTEADENGLQDYDLGDEEVWWDSSEPDLDNTGRCTVLCNNDHEWRTTIEWAEPAATQGP